MRVELVKAQLIVELILGRFVLFTSKLRTRVYFNVFILLISNLYGMTVHQVFSTREGLAQARPNYI